MKTRTVLLVIGCAVVAGSMVYGVCHLWILQRTFARECALSCELSELRYKLLGYRLSHGRWPEALAELKLDEISARDPISGKPFLYFSNAKPSSHANLNVTPSSENVLVTQPETYRWGLWPLAETRRQVVLTNGDCRLFYGQEAVTICPTQ